MNKTDRIMPLRKKNKPPFAALILTAMLSIPGVAHSETLSVGLASVDATPEIGVPLSGFSGRRIYPWDVFDRHPYSTFLKPSTEVFDPIRIKAMFLENGREKLLFISVDVVAVTNELRAEVIGRLSSFGIGDNNLFINATHTHSGPGAWSENLIWEVVMIDRLQEAVRKKLVDDIVQAAEKAIRKQTPASLYSVAFDVQRLQKNRNRANPRDYVIKTANLLLAKDAGTGGWLGGLVNFAVHGVAVRRRDTGFSADIPGSIERNLEGMLMLENAGPEERPTMLFINGAVGDVTTRTKGRKELEKIGGSFADQTRSHLKNLQPVSPHWKTKSATFDIGEAGLHLKTCAESPFLKKLMPESATLPLSPWFPKRTTVWMIELGDIAMMTWPGEPTTSLGRRDLEITRSPAFRQTWILGLTNDYLAYFTTPDEFKTGSYEACFSLYGPGLGNSIVEQHKSLSLTP